MTEQPTSRRRTIPVFGFLILGALIAGGFYLSDGRSESGTKSLQERHSREELVLTRDLIPQTGPRIVDLAPDQLDHEPLFQRAMADADRGMELKDRALEAKKAGDTQTFERVGRQAFDILDGAFRSVENWELKIIDSYGAEDGQVRAILVEITRWKKARDAFIKIPGIVDGPGSADRE